ncbi:MAG: EthD domain-containing protein [Novosphingobium sp.]
MAETAYKIALLMKRRPDISVEAFRDYYENRHAPLASKYSQGVTRYVRRYLDPQPHPETGPGGELPYDVITELWFDDEATFKRTLAYITTAKMPAEIVEDEKNFLDRSSFKIVTYTECESDLSRVETAGDLTG